MTDKPENPPAFPQLCYEAGERDAHGDLIEPFTTSKGGMTLRDYFAGQALIALPNIGCGADLSQEEYSLAAYQIADQMLIARTK